MGMGGSPPLRCPPPPLPCWFNSQTWSHKRHFKLQLYRSLDFTTFTKEEPYLQTGKNSGYTPKYRYAKLTRQSFDGFRTGEPVSLGVLR